ncbi:DnaD domain-containing protein [Streptococcus sp. H31]|uniref:DnaD domain-containing protein n=1 Tax=Streptococcus huangxiaojuni TaxID=3237239 RepID=UPI0034A5CD20
MDLKELIDNFESNYGRMLSPFEIEDIQKWVTEDGYTIELINEALRIAIRNGKYFTNYIAGILIRMKSRGITTVQQLKAAEAEKIQSTKTVEVSNEFIQMLIYAAKMWIDEPDAEIQRLEELKDRG